MAFRFLYPHIFTLGMVAVLLITQLAIAHIHSHGVALSDPYHDFIAAILFASFVTYFEIYITHHS